MAMLEDLEHLPMTELETALKKILSQRPDIQSRVLSSQELFDYISWMAETFGHQVHLAPEKIPSFAATADINAIGRKLIDDPGNPLALQRLAAGYTEQSEERYISGGHDISAFRMFRYMPSHWHTNDYFEIYYTFSGSCPIYFRDETINAKPGTILIVAPGVLHATPCYSDDCCLVYCMVRASTFERVFWNQLPKESLMSSFFHRALEGGQATAYLQFDSGDDPGIRRLMKQIYAEYQQGEAYSAQMINALMTAFLLLTLRRYEGTARLPRTDDFFWRHEFSAIFTYIQTNYAHTSLKEISDRFHYSERQITRIVGQNTGLTFAQLIVKLRMEKAAALLRQGEMSAENISEAVGYANLSSFYRTFQKYYGLPPTAWLHTSGEGKNR